MTDDRHLTHDELVLHYYGDAGGEARRFERHLASCAECGLSLERLSRTLSLVDASPADEPDAGFEGRVWARLAPALETPAPWWQRVFGGVWMQWAAAGLATAAVAAAFAGGWWLRGPSEEAAPAVAVAPASGPEGTPAAAPSGAEDFRSRILDLAAGDHLERTEIALAELMHEGGAGSDERDRAADLVAVSRLLRQSAEQNGDAALDGLLGEIELVLMELANAPPGGAADAIAALRARVESRDLLFRLRVLGHDIRRKQDTPAAPATKGKTS